MLLPLVSAAVATAAWERKLGTATEFTNQVVDNQRFKSVAVPNLSPLTPSSPREYVFAMQGRFHASARGVRYDEKRPEFWRFSSDQESLLDCNELKNASNSNSSW
jgi:hypothetical protein